MVINCEFSAEALEDKLLNRLDKTQESVQELSRWLIKNHKNGDVVVKTWVWLLIKKQLFAQARHLQKLKLLKANKAKMPSPSDQFNKEKKFNIFGKRCSSKWN